MYLLRPDSLTGSAVAPAAACTVQLQGHKGDMNVHSQGSSCSAGELLSED